MSRSRPSRGGRDDEDIMAMQEDWLQSREKPSASVIRTKVAPKVKTLRDTTHSTLPSEKQEDGETVASLSSVSVSVASPSAADQPGRGPVLAPAAACGSVVERKSSEPLPMRIATGPRVSASSRFKDRQQHEKTEIVGDLKVPAGVPPLGDVVKERDVIDDRQLPSKGEGIAGGWPAIPHRSEVGNGSNVGFGRLISNGSEGVRVAESAVSGTPMTMSTGPIGSESQGIHQRNLDVIRGMSSSDVSEACAELEATFSAATLNALRERGRRKLMSVNQASIAATASSDEPPLSAETASAQERSVSQSNSVCTPAPPVAKRSAISQKKVEFNETGPHKHTKIEEKEAPPPALPIENSGPRVDENGEVVIVPVDSTSPALDTYGDFVPDRSGFSLEELMVLATSEHKASRRLAARALGGVLNRRRRVIVAGESVAHTHLPHRLPEVLLHLCRACNVTGSMATIEALSALEAYIVPHVDELEWTTRPSRGGWLGHMCEGPSPAPQVTQEELKEEGDAPFWLQNSVSDEIEDTEEEHSENRASGTETALSACRLDPVKGLVRLGLLTQVAHHMKNCVQETGAHVEEDQTSRKLLANVALLCIRILIVIARRSQTYAAKLVLEPHLIHTLREFCLEPSSSGDAPVPLSGSSDDDGVRGRPALWCARLVRALCESGCVVALHLVNSKVDVVQSCLNLLALGGGSKAATSACTNTSVLHHVQEEVLYVWRACLAYGLEVDLADHVLPLVQSFTSTSAGETFSSDVCSGAVSQWDMLASTSSSLSAALYRCLAQLATACCSPNTTDLLQEAKAVSKCRPSEQALAALSDRLDTIASVTATYLQKLAETGTLGIDHIAIPAMVHFLAVSVGTHFRRTHTARRSSVSQLTAVAASVGTAMLKSSAFIAAVHAVCVPSGVPSGKEQPEESVALACDWLSGLFRLVLACTEQDPGTVCAVGTALLSDANTLAAMHTLCMHAKMSSCSVTLARASLMVRVLACFVVHKSLFGRDVTWPHVAAAGVADDLLSAPFFLVSELDKGDEYYAVGLIRIGLASSSVYICSGRDRVGQGMLPHDQRILDTLYCESVCSPSILARSKALYESQWWDVKSLQRWASVPSPESTSPSPSMTLLPLPVHWLLLPLSSQGEGGALAAKLIGECMSLLVHLERSCNAYIASIAPEVKLYHLMASCLHGTAVIADDRVTFHFDELLEKWTVECERAVEKDGQGSFEERLAAAVQQAGVERRADSKPPPTPNSTETTATEALMSQWQGGTQSKLYAFASDLASLYAADSYGHPSFGAALLVLFRPRTDARVRAMLWKDLGALGLLSLLLPPTDTGGRTVPEWLQESTTTQESESSVALDAYVEAMKHQNFRSSSQGGPLFVYACNRLANHLWTTSSTGDRKGLTFGQRSRFTALWSAGGLTGPLSKIILSDMINTSNNEHTVADRRAVLELYTRDMQEEERKDIIGLLDGVLESR